jgi:2-keto-4-pentenoate hydratase/2-oxohepta-3-ene-1,7-dioic acid hydratase in catechol pathway
VKFRRRYQPDLGRFIPQAWENDGWVDLDEHPEFCRPGIDTSSRAVNGGALPFQPLSFRDFMIYEAHAINASRGYVRRFVPKLSRVASAYEALTKRTFPVFKPRPLWYRQPIYYMSNHLAFVPSGRPVRAPSYTKALDYELELGFVLARPLFNATPDEALAAIGAFVVLNDFSARDVQRDEMQSGFGPQKAKHFLSSMSEIAVTADELLPVIEKLKASVRINGREVAATSTAGMRYSLGQVLAHASKDEQLFAGELFGTGTLPGGCALENGCWLKPGDVLHLQIDGVGEIEHAIL